MNDIDFKHKITGNRPLESKKKSPTTLDMIQFAYESDRGRIINSAAIRRLQQKTQVFPLERNAAVRSRLTHSLEVQQVGRYIVQTIFRHLGDRAKSYGLDGLERQFESLVEMSCLMHDIGNPPFGHFGEQAINDWFIKNIESLLPSVQLSERLHRDITQFEGNAQAIRLTYTLLNLNLTYAQTAGIMKYTREGTELAPTDEEKQTNHQHSKHYLKKKVGYYFSEQRYIDQLRQSLSIGAGCRHPVSYIMEAADDISYGIADIEDAVEKNILTIEQLSDALREEFRHLCHEYGLTDASDTDVMNKVLQAATKKADNENICKTSQYFIELRVKLNHRLVEHASQRFINNIEATYHGTFNQALLEDNSLAHALSETLKNVAKKHVFNHKEVEASELKGYRIIKGLLDCYKPLLQMSKSDFKRIIDGEKQTPLYESRLFKKLSNKHLKAYQSAMINHPTDVDSDQLEFYYRCRLIQDYISGMTDQYALDEYRLLMVVN
ncbi:MAG: dGTPase [Aliivibrio sp.]|uniref:dGTPase n=1 Tax=Aliivibrio sp. TaxID=1872443 RepID=UPI001A41A1D2|nr:dGTPase [Aliivibrio sp.]